jgi:galactokinase
VATILTVTDDTTLAPDRLLRVLEQRHAGAPGDMVSARVVRAPGRVNLIGEHTDYNDGFVLPVAVDLEVRMAVVWTDDRRVRLVRDDTGETAAFDLDELPAPGSAWHSYVAGVAWSLADAGLPTRGLRGILASTVPIGAGLSSSAALEMAAAWALSGPQGPALDPMSVARLAQRAENEHVGVRCGLMDQFASACGVAGHALLLDCRSLEWRAVPMPADLVLVVIHTGVPRALGSSEYNARRADCEHAAAVIAERHPGVRSLRDVDLEMLAGSRDRLEPRVHARAHHIITENGRVMDAVAALEAGDRPALGRLMAESHASLRDRYEVSCPELDVLVELASAMPGVVGSRMTGAGFGGCTVTLALPEAVEPLWERVLAEYPGRTGRTPRMWTLRAVDGAGFLEP